MRRLIILLSVLLSACGFHLRGNYTLPWDTFHVGLPENNPLYFLIKRGIESSSQTRLVTDVKVAEASLQILGDLQAKTILSLSAKGLVREYQLTRTFTYRIKDAKGNEIVAPSTIILQRNLTFDDAHLFAKEAEETMIWNEMQNDLVQQLLRRLSTVKPKPAG